MDAAARYSLRSGPELIVDGEEGPLPAHYRAAFTSPDGELERFLTEGGRAAMLDALDRGQRSFTRTELDEMTVEARMDALLKRYDEEAGVGG